MKKPNVTLKINLTDAESAYDVYKAFALAKSTKHLSKIERSILETALVNDFLETYGTYVLIKPEICEECDEECTTDSTAKTEKKPNFFKRLWRKLFKKSSK